MKALLRHFYELYVLALQTQTRKMILIFAILFKFFDNFCHFPASGARESPLRFNNWAPQSFLYFLDVMEWFSTF